MTVVVARNVNTARIRVNKTAAGVMTQPPGGGVTVRTTAVDGSAGGGVDELSELLDVDAASPQDGETLVYNDGTGKFESTLLAIDGGTF